MEKVMLAMSGGVDSSTVLLLLREKYNLIAATLKLFDDSPQNFPKKSVCGSLSDIDTAKEITGRFNVPHHIFDLSDRFKEQVIERFSDVYMRGGTPNPCIDCNQHIKFSSLLEKASEHDCQYLATGHYARVEYERGRWLLKKAICNGLPNPKDQSYVLYTLTQEQLSRVIFPLGEMSKEMVRELAAQNDLINSKKPDSQDICFIPDGDYTGFIKRFQNKDLPKGFFVDKSGKILGEHEGIIKYTIGQRRGIGLSSFKPLYVTGKNALNNTVMLGEEEDLMSRILIADNLNWISIENPGFEIRVAAKTRYSQSEQPCTVKPLGNGQVKVVFDLPQRAITPGQRVVFYDNDIVVGGGRII